MKYRDNKKENLTTPFVLATGFDQLLKAWPTEGIPINDPARFPADEQALIPVNGRTIRSSLFNGMADALVGIQHRLKDNAGKAYQIAADGTYTLCSELAPLNDLIARWTTSFTNTDIRLAYVRETLTSTLAVGGTAYSFTADIDVPATIGALASSNNVGVIVSPKIRDNTETGLWYNKTGNILTEIEDVKYIAVSHCPDYSDPTVLKVYGQVITNGSSVTAASATYSWNNYITKTETLQQIQADPNHGLRGFSYKAKHPLFWNYYANTPEALTELSAVPGSLIRTRINASMDWDEAKNAVSPIYPYRDNDSERGISGGILSRNRTKYPDSTTNPQDVFIDFMYHGYHSDYFMPGYLEANGGYLTRSGVFLRMYRSTNPSDWPASIDITLSGNYDYRNYPWYQGYLLRFNSDRISSADASNGTFAIPTRVGSWAIMKVQYEQFGATSDSPQYWWPNVNDTETLPTTGVTYYSANTAPYDDAPPGRWSVLAYAPDGEEFIPCITRSVSNRDVFQDTGQRWIYRFQIIGSTISVLKREQSSSTWTEVLSVTDPDPQTAVANAEYFPSGLYGGPGIWGGDASTSGRFGRNGILGLSNITEGTFGIGDPSKTIDLDCLFFKLPGEDSNPSIS